jgi:hypothetical protein
MWRKIDWALDLLSDVAIMILGLAILWPLVFATWALSWRASDVSEEK